MKFQRRSDVSAALARIAAALLCLIAVLSCCASAFAEPVDPDMVSGLTVIWKPAAADEESFAGTQFRAYRVADVSSSVEFTPTENFSKYGLSLNGLSAQEWFDLAVLLSGNVKRDYIPADSSGLLGADGTLTFPGVCKPGLYLVVGDKHEGNDLIYTPQPAMVSIPDKNEDDGAWSYNVSAVLKYTAADKQMNLKVTKIWADAGYSSYRPSSVAVRILCDGEKYTDVYLNKSNNWTWTLENVDPSKTWDVKELSENTSYTTTYKRYDYDILTSFYITNTRAYTPLTSTSYYTGIWGGGTGISARYLPQTGMLWWPVPILAVCGIACVLIGLKKRGGGR